MQINQVLKVKSPCKHRGKKIKAIIATLGYTKNTLDKFVLIKESYSGKNYLNTRHFNGGFKCCNKKR